MENENMNETYETREENTDVVPVETEKESRGDGTLVGMAIGAGIAAAAYAAVKGLKMVYRKLKGRKNAAEEDIETDYEDLTSDDEE